DSGDDPDGAAGSTSVVVDVGPSVLAWRSPSPSSTPRDGGSASDAASSPVAVAASVAAVASSSPVLAPVSAPGAGDDGVASEAGSTGGGVATETSASSAR